MQAVGVSLGAVKMVFVCRADMSDQRIGYSINVMRRSEYLVAYPVTDDNLASFFNCTPAGRDSDSVMVPT